MKKSSVVGRTIVEINQHRFWNEQLQRMDMSLNWLQLDNGKRIYFVAHDTDTEPFVRGWVE